MKEDKSAQPAALICGECFAQQSKTPNSAVDEYYCEHNQVWAIRRPDGGWLLSTEVSPEDHRALLEDARQLQSIDDNATIEAAAPSLH